MNYFFRLVLLYGLFSVPGLSFSQSSNELAAGYYVVVGAYAESRENIAQNYVETLRLKGITSSYGFNSSRHLYFVYLKFFDNLRDALRYMKDTRKEGVFTDAWVRVVHGDIVKTPQPVARAEQVEESEKKPDSQPVPSPEIIQPVEVKPETVVTDNPPIVQHPVMTLGNTEVFLSLYHARNNRIVEGQVNVIDTDRARLITSVKGNEYLVLPDPKSKSGQLTLICEAFGYRKIQQEINYPLPLADTVKSYIDLMGTTLVINFDLVRYQKGDIGTLYNVYFYNDAALMLPESKYELNSLLQLMNESPGSRIRLHGHTNGNYSGKILTVGPEKNFFSLDGAKQGMGSAKDLSRDRAEVIKQFLISNGVDASRMEVKAWGGKRPIFDKNGANAKKNVRVEVEMLQE
jgi:outer membrane protein OmpA-like peptidoglycan-associated protein